jgi:hypothetical protein
VRRRLIASIGGLALALSLLATPVAAVTLITATSELHIAGGSGALDIHIPIATTFDLTLSADRKTMGGVSMDVPADRVGAVAVSRLEADVPTSEYVMVIHFPRDMTADGEFTYDMLGTTQPFRDLATGAKLPAGDYRITLLTEPGQSAAATLRFPDLATGALELAATEPAALQVWDARDDSSPDDQLLFSASKEFTIGSDTSLVAVLSFIGDFPGAHRSETCFYGGGVSDPIFYTTPVCVPRASATGSDMYFGTSPGGAYAPLPVGEGKGLFRPMLGVVGPGRFGVVLRHESAGTSYNVRGIVLAADL